MTIQDSSRARSAEGDDRAASGLGALEAVVGPTRAVVVADVAAEIADLVREQPEAVLGLATGGTMVELYAELVRLHREEGLDLSRVTTFNLDEYLGLDEGDTNTFRSFMDVHLFEPAKLDRTRTNFPDSIRAATDPLAASREYEDAIAAAGGIDLQLLGLGRNGHIGFNEPGSLRESRTRVITLDARTREDATGTFGALENVPTAAITVGVATILEARRVCVLAFGERKADVVLRTVTGDVGPEVPSTFLRGHADAVLHIDTAAASQLFGR